MFYFKIQYVEIYLYIFYYLYIKDNSKTKIKDNTIVIKSKKMITIMNN